MIFSDRKHPPHLTTLDRDAVILLLTVCTRNRRKILAHEWVHQLIRRSWIQCSDYSVGRYVIMPEHIHVFVGEYDQKWLYVRNNPIRHGLVEDADEWLFQGAINILS